MVRHTHNENFTLHPRLNSDSYYVVNLPLCQVRLVNNQDFMWVLLVPRINNSVHFTDLSQEEQITLTQEINFISEIFMQNYQPDRLNIGALGNIVSQMHWHIIVRNENDPAWPGPVWGHKSTSYAPQILEERINKLRTAIDEKSAIEEKCTAEL